MPNFREIGSKTADDISRPPLPPPGGYLWRIVKPHEVRDVKSGEREWEAVEFSVKAVAPTADVDSDALREYGSVDKIINRVSFMFDKNDKVAFETTEFQLKKFLEDHVQCWKPGMTLSEALSAAVNSEFIGTIVWKADKNDGDIFHANIQKTAPKS